MPSFARRIAFTIILVMMSLASVVLPAPAFAAPVCPTSQVALETAITSAGPGGTVTFGCDTTIVFNHATSLPTVIIDGNGYNVTLSGDDAYRIFDINGNVTLRGLTIVHGHTAVSNDAGAVNVAQGASLRVEHSTFSENRSDVSWGGAITNRGSLTVVDSSFTLNSADSGGALANIGALDHSNIPTMTVIDSTFVGNSSQNGGAIFSIRGNLNITGSVLYSNDGNLTVDTRSSTTTIANSTVARSQLDALLATNGTLTITNSTFSGNTYRSIRTNSVSVVTVTNSILDDPCSLDIDPATGVVVFTDGGGNITTDASCPVATLVTPSQLALGSLADNGGPTQTFALLPGSAAIGVGISAVCNAEPINGKDQRGFARPATTCDSGAYDTDTSSSDSTPPVIAATLDPASPDGDNGWYTSDVMLTWSAVEAESTVSLVTTGCDNQSITSDQVMTTYSCSATSDGGTAGPVEVEIGRDATPPVVSITGVVDGATYPVGSVPAASCTSTDATSGVAADAGLSISGGPLGLVTATCAGATDNAGNLAAPVSVTYTVGAVSAPTITPDISGTLGDNGWYTSDVTVSWTIDDGGSPIISSTGCDITTSTSDTSGTTLTCSATNAGGTSSESVTFKRDATAPVITDLGAALGPNGANGWYTSPVTNTFEVSDNLSGFAAPLPNPYTISAASGTAEGSAVTIDSQPVSDNAGNEAPSIVSAAFKIDLSDPTDVTFVGDIADGSSYASGSVPAASTCTATDAVSGLVSCIVSGYSIALGSHTLTATATDIAGRTATATLTYSVVDDTTPAITYTLDPAAPDGDNGWYTSDVTLTWTIVENESPSSLETMGCVDQAITADQAATLYSCIAGSLGGTAPPASVTIQRDATTPVVSVTGVTDGAAYAVGSVPVAGCSNTDTMSGIATNATLTLSGGPLGTVTATCAGAVDAAGNTGSASVSYSVIDNTPPTISYTLNPATPDGNNGWYTGDVTLTWTVSEPESPMTLTLVGCNNQTVTFDQSLFTYSCSATSDGGSAAPVQVTIKRDATGPQVVVTGVTNGASYGVGFVPTAGCYTIDAPAGVATLATLTLSGGPLGTITATCSGAVDNAGNTGSASVTYSVGDSTPPTITYTLDPATPDGTNGWYTDDVTLTWTVTEPETPDTLMQVGCANQTITVDQTETTYSCSATSAGGAAAQVDVSIGRDATAPMVAVTGIADGTVYMLGDTIPTVGCTTIDAISGVAIDATLVTTGGPVGAITLTCSGATDTAGNTAAPVSVTYYIVYAWSGFFRPVDNLPAINVVKAGSTVPVKFALAGNQGLAAVVSITSGRVACDTSGPVEDVEETVTAGQSRLQYDATTGRYTWVWKTDKTWSTTCRVLTVTLADGTSHQSLFTFR